jgi:hypothetical protein
MQFMEPTPLRLCERRVRQRAGHDLLRIVLGPEEV